ncbi:Tim44/TimA family putative adaptor protein [Chachezhania antarctica]|uniref:Tim44/TimA family putative adaptor protein n=1 Tax=Chachezhania antarctica TaxID=2340860 RepID=UPI000EABAD74|nr:Tim44/TimA family putative adaptor protein [Chachezhania antarctica]|tara:strand:+ start:1187 stop:1843 length:657 start_codon:yes stop_codon:yes gene_type:complete
MQSPLLHLLILAGIAIFLILRLRNVLGTREGFEKPQVPETAARAPRPDFEVIEGGPDHDITDYVEEGSKAADALAAMKRVEPSFSVTEFVQGARGAYEMIILGFDKGNLSEIEPYLAEDVFETFVDVVSQREDQGLTVQSEFIGVREIALADADFAKDTGRAEITMRFVGELTSVVKDREGNVIEGSSTTSKRQKDTWTFARTMGSDDPNWLLVATDA